MSGFSGHRHFAGAKCEGERWESRLIDGTNVTEMIDTNRRFHKVLEGIARAKGSDPLMSVAQEGLGIIGVSTIFGSRDRFVTRR